MTLEQLVSQLHDVYGTSLHAVVLYGSAVAGEHIKKKSDYNVLVIADDLPLERIKAMAGTMRAWRKEGNPPPLVFTTREWQAASDVFPMEYADILERHRTLYGAEDLFAGITVSREHLRLQAEREALGKVFRLRQGALLAGTDASAKLELLSASLSAVMVLFRAVVRLTGKEPPTNYADLVREVAAQTGMDPAAYDTVVRHVRGEKSIPKDEAGSVLARYLIGMEQLTAYLNEFSVARSAQ